MQVYHRYENLPECVFNAATAIGNFDGVHLGHQKIIQQAEKISSKYKIPLNVLTFEPHPYTFFKSKTEGFKITSLRKKIEVISSVGVDNLIIMHFDKKFAKISAKDFIEDILVKGLRINSVVVGEGYRFGHNRAGDKKLFLEEGKKLGFKVYEVKTVMNAHKTDRVSSSLIRMMISRGEIKKANKMLGRPFEIEGFAKRTEVNAISKVFPTVKVNYDKYITPRHGVYVSKLGVYNSGNLNDITWYDSVTDFGVRPSVANERVPSLETHIIGEHIDLHDKRIKICFYDFLRPEIKADSMETLIKNITADVHWSKIILNHINNPEIPLLAFKHDV